MIGFIIGAYLLIASISDIRTREIPDILSYSFIASGLAFSAIKSIIYWDLSFLISLSAVILLWLISLLLFYGGQWGGGDSKLLMGMGAWYGLSIKMGVFFLNLFVFGAVYGLLFALILVLKNRKKILPFIRKYHRERLFVRIASFLLLISVFFITDRFTQLLVLMLDALFFFGYYAILFIKAVESEVLVKKIPVSKLTEGDWVLDTVKVGKDIIYQPKKTGITIPDIEMLKKNSIKEVTVREGIPFVPSFFIAFVITEMAGPWITRIIHF